MLMRWPKRAPGNACASHKHGRAFISFEFESTTSSTSVSAFGDKNHSDFLFELWISSVNFCRVSSFCVWEWPVVEDEVCSALAYRSMHVEDDELGPLSGESVFLLLIVLLMKEDCSPFRPRFLKLFATNLVALSPLLYRLLFAASFFCVFLPFSFLVGVIAASHCRVLLRLRLGSFTFTPLCSWFAWCNGGSIYPTCFVSQYFVYLWWPITSCKFQ